MGTRKGGNRYRNRMHVPGAGASLEGKGLCQGHLWDTRDAEVETPTRAEKHNGKLKRLFLLPNFLTSGTSDQQAVTIKECTLTNSKYPLNN